MFRNLTILSVLALACVPALADPITFICDYPVWSDSTGRHLSDKRFTLTFVVDAEADKAYMLGNNGSERVSVVKREGQVSFIELTSTGNVMTTTIAGDLKSVHSRNSVVVGDLTPSQYYGTCQAK
jgi:uncharacterized protein YuzE